MIWDRSTLFSPEINPIKQIPNCTRSHFLLSTAQLHYVLYNLEMYIYTLTLSSKLPNRMVWGLFLFYNNFVTCGQESLNTLFQTEALQDAEITDFMAGKQTHTTSKTMEGSFFFISGIFPFCINALPWSRNANPALI